MEGGDYSPPCYLLVPTFRLQPSLGRGSGCPGKGGRREPVPGADSDARVSQSRGDTSRTTINSNVLKRRPLVEIKLVLCQLLDSRKLSESDFPIYVFYLYYIK